MRNWQDLSILAGRILLAGLFAAGAVQKLVAPDAAQTLLAERGWPVALIWPAAAFNALAVVSLLSGWWLAPMAFLMALYCVVTSLFHLVPEDPWQMSILVKNWAIAGGLLVLAGHAATRR